MMSKSVFDYAPQLAGIEGTEPSVADLVRFYYKQHNCPSKYADEYLSLLSIQQEADAKWLHDVLCFLDDLSEFDPTYKPGTKPTNRAAELKLRFDTAMATPTDSEAKTSA